MVKEFFKLPFSKARHIVSFVFSANTVKFACLKVTSGKTEVTGVKICNFEGLSDDEAARTIKEALREFKLAKPTAVCSIDAGSVITKNIEIPSVKDTEIKGIIDLQAGRYTPYGRNEIIVDYVNIGTYHNSYSKVIIVIVVCELVKKQLAILNKAGFSVRKVQILSEAIGCVSSKLMGLSAKANPTIIVTIDDKNSDFAVIFKGKTIFLRNIPLGSDSFRSDREVYREKFAQELKKSVDAYRTEDIEAQPDEIFFIGTADCLEAVKPLATQILAMPAKDVLFYSGLSFFPVFLSEKKDFSFVDCVSSALAFNDTKIDLRPSELKLKMSFHDRSREIMKTGIFVMSILVVLCGILMLRIYYRALYLSKLEKELKTVDKQVEDLEKISTKVMVIKRFVSQRGRPLDILSQLHDIVSDEIYIKSISIDEMGNVDIKGTANVMSEVFVFVTALENSKLFKAVTAKNTSSRKEGSKDVSDFEIAATLEEGI